MCPMYLGVKAVIAKSLERIHSANLVNFGIVPLVFADPADYDAIEAGDALVIPEARRKVEQGEPLTIENRTQKRTFAVEHGLSERQGQIILAGGLLNFIKATA